MGLFSKEKNVARDVIDGLPEQNRLDDVRLKAEDLQRAYRKAIDLRLKLREVRDHLDVLEADANTPAIDIQAAAADVRTAEDALRNADAVLKVAERRAKAAYPQAFRS